MTAQEIADGIRRRLARLRDWLLAQSLETYVAVVVSAVLGYALHGCVG